MILVVDEHWAEKIRQAKHERQRCPKIFQQNEKMFPRFNKGNRGLPNLPQMRLNAWDSAILSKFTPV